MFGHTVHEQESDNTVPRSIFAAPPINLRVEVAAYESLWLSQGAWFKNIAELFDKNPSAVPSELVPEQTASETWKALLAHLGEERLQRLGVQIHGAAEYPLRLRDASHPIELVYYLGNWELVDTPGVAVVGTRDPTQEGIEGAARVARALVKHGFTVVSGLARGIDTAAHTAAIEASGRTIAVIGTPIFESYPRENSALQEQIARDHLLISQVPFLRYKQQPFKSNSYFFPERNVTMSALTKATVIVEAGNTSGTLVQARAALAQGRKLFILESCFRKPELTWPEKFLAKGAIRVAKPAEIIEALQDAAPPTD